MGFISGITNKCFRQDNDKLNIISWVTHEAYSFNLAKTGHNFYLLQGEGINTWKEWNRPVPRNCIILEKEKPPLPDVNYDLILSQNKFGQIQKAIPLSREIHLPILSLEHTFPLPNWPKIQLEQIKTMKGDINLFISESNRSSWGWKENEADIIHHGIDTEFFAMPNSSIKRKPVILSIANDFVNRSWCLGFDIWQQTVKDLPVQVYGDTPGLSKPTQSMYQLQKIYQDHSIFLNTATYSPIPCVVLEAASSSCAIISLNRGMIPSIFTHGHDALLGDNASELREHCVNLINNPEECHRLGENSRKTIQEKFSLMRHIENWNKYFYKAANMIYKGF